MSWREILNGNFESRNRYAQFAQYAKIGEPAISAYCAYSAYATDAPIFHKPEPPPGREVARELDADATPTPELAEAVEDLAEHFAERAAILEYDAHLPREQAEAEAAAMTATLARNRGYPWGALRLALASRPDLAAEVPDSMAVVDKLLWGPARLAVIPGRRVVPQGAHFGRVNDEDGERG